MSRTYKDKHFLSELKHRYLIGDIKHNHCFLSDGYTFAYNNYVLSTQLSRSFYKQDYVHLCRYVNKIKNNYPDSIIDIEEHKIVVDTIDNTFYFNDDYNFSLIDNDNGEIFNINDYPGIDIDNHRKTVMYSVYVHFIHTTQLYYTKYCTDWKHYDIETNTDLRDGGIVTCKPDIDKASFHYGYNWRDDCDFCATIEYKREKNKDKDFSKKNLNTYKQYFNSGLSIE